MSLPSLATSNSLYYRFHSAFLGVFYDVSEMSLRRLSVSPHVGLTVGFETPKTSKTPILNLLSDIIPIESIYPLVSSRFLPT